MNLNNNSKSMAFSHGALLFLLPQLKQTLWQVGTGYENEKLSLVQ